MVIFKEDTHQYFKDQKELISTTTLMRKHHLAPDYTGVSVEVLNAKARRGSYIHKEIEMFVKNNELGFTNELQLFIDKIRELQRQVLYSEKLVADDLVAGTIDLVFGNKIIADIKTTYQLHIQSVRWQISIYVYLYDRDHYGEYKGEVWWFKDGDLKVVEIELLPIEKVERLFECERNGEIYVEDEDTSKIERLLSLLKEQEILDLEIKALKNEINESVKKNGNITNEHITISYVAPSVSIGFDLDTFKKEQPELFAKYNNKKTEKKESFRYLVK